MTEAERDLDVLSSSIRRDLKLRRRGTDLARWEVYETIGQRPELASNDVVHAVGSTPHAAVAAAEAVLT